MEYLMDILTVVIGVSFGTLIHSFIMFRRSAHGVLKIDHSNPDKDLYRFEIDDLETLSEKKQVVLKIDHADLSQN